MPQRPILMLAKAATGRSTYARSACAGGPTVLSMEEILEQVRDLVIDTLPARPTHASHALARLACLNRPSICAARSIQSEPRCTWRRGA